MGLFALRKKSTFSVSNLDFTVNANTLSSFSPHSISRVSLSVVEGPRNRHVSEARQNVKGIKLQFDDFIYPQGTENNE